MKTRSKLLYIIALLLMLLSAFPVMGVAAKKKPPKQPKSDKKVVFCHRTGNGKFVRINVSKKASKAHLKHGDGYPGEAVPGMEGKFFDETCGVLEATLEASTMELAGGEWGSVSCKAEYSVVGGGYKDNTFDVASSQAARPKDGSPLTFGTITFTYPEEGWVVQNGGDTQNLTVFAYCLPASP